MNTQQLLPLKLYSHDRNQSIINGLVLPPKLTNEVLKIFPKLPFRSEDVVVATYPKSGTTWVKEIIWQISHNGIVDKISIHKRIPYLDILPEAVGATADNIIQLVESHPSRIFHIHFPIDFLPVHKTTSKEPMPRNVPKYVCVMRNPKDNAVSLFHFYLGIYHIEFDGTWDEFFEMFITGKVLYGSWFDHVLGWWQHREDPNILIVKYEDMKKDLPATVNRLAEFIGKAVSPELVEKISNQTTFDAMKDQEQYDIRDFYKETEKFFRKGQVGDWKNYFSADQNRRMDEIIQEKLSGTGLQFEYE